MCIWASLGTKSLRFAYWSTAAKPPAQQSQYVVVYLPTPTHINAQLNLLSNFAANYHAAVNGRGTSPDGIEMNELYGGARIR